MTFDSNIRKPEDLIGKSIGIGTRTQSVWGIYAMAQLEAWGITEDNANVQWLGTSTVQSAFVDGAIDVSVSNVYSGAGEKPGVQESLPLTNALATGKDLYYIGATKEEALKASGGRASWPIKMVPAGSLPFQDKDIWGLYVQAGFGAHKDFPEDVAYELVTFILEHYKVYWPAHSLYQLLTPTLVGVSSGFSHNPGALRAYEDYAKANPGSEAAKFWKEWGLIK